MKPGLPDDVRGKAQQIGWDQADNAYYLRISDPFDHVWIVRLAECSYIQGKSEWHPFKPTIEGEFGHWVITDPNGDFQAHCEDVSLMAEGVEPVFRLEERGTCPREWPTDMREDFLLDILKVPGFPGLKKWVQTIFKESSIMVTHMVNPGEPDYRYEACAHILGEWERLAQHAPLEKRFEAAVDMIRWCKILNVGYYEELRDCIFFPGYQIMYQAADWIPVLLEDGDDEPLRSVLEQIGRWFAQVEVSDACDQPNTPEYAIHQYILCGFLEHVSVRTPKQGQHLLALADDNLAESLRYWVLPRPQ